MGLLFKKNESKNKVRSKILLKHIVFLKLISTRKSPRNFSWERGSVPHFSTQEDVRKTRIFDFDVGRYNPKIVPS